MLPYEIAHCKEHRRINGPHDHGDPGRAVRSEHVPRKGNTAPKSVFPLDQDIHTQVAYTRWSGVHRAPTFTAMVADYLKDDEYRALQLFPAGDPEAGDEMPHTGGFASCDGPIGAGARASVAASG